METEMHFSQSLRRLFKRSEQSSTVSASNNVPKILPFMEKRVLLNIDTSATRIADSLFIFHTLNDEKAGGDANNNSELVRPVYCNIIRVTDRNDIYNPELPKTLRIIELEEIVPLLGRINDEISDCYRKEERRLTNHLQETGNDYKYCVWGVSKWCLKLIEQIYTIVTPLIVASRKLHKNLRSSKSYKELIVPFPLTVSSSKTPCSQSSSTCTQFVKVKDLQVACDSYLKQIEDDVNNIHRALIEVGPVDEPNVYDAYVSLNDGETVYNRSSPHDTVNLKIRKLVDWKTYRNKVIYLEKLAESEKLEHDKLEENFHKLFDATRKKFQDNREKLYEKLDFLTKEEFWQQFQITNNYWVRRIKYDRQIEYSKRMRTDPMDEVHEWGCANKERDRIHKRNAACRKAWLDAKLKWQKLVPKGLIAEVSEEILRNIGDADEKTRSMKPLDVGVDIKAFGFVPNYTAYELHQGTPGNSGIESSKPRHTNLQVLQNNEMLDLDDSDLSSEFGFSDEGTTLSSLSVESD